MNLGDKVPKLAPCAFVAPSASVIGQVTVGKGASIWYGSILRGTSPRISTPPGHGLPFSPVRGDYCRRVFRSTAAKGSVCTPPERRPARAQHARGDRFSKP
jgi:hypothetical protein